jgi:hypothetical protein
LIPKSFTVVPGFMPGIHVLLVASKTWMAGTSPAMTIEMALPFGGNCANP